MIGTLELSPKTNTYKMFIATLCEKNDVNAALGILEKMESANCSLRATTFCPLITILFLKYQLDKLQLVFEMMKMKGCPPNLMTYNLALSKLC